MMIVLSQCPWLAVLLIGFLSLTPAVLHSQNDEKDGVRPFPPGSVVESTQTPAPAQARCPSRLRMVVRRAAIGTGIALSGVLVGLAPVIPTDYGYASLAARVIPGIRDWTGSWWNTRFNKAQLHALKEWSKRRDEAVGSNWSPEIALAGRASNASPTAQKAYHDMLLQYWAPVVFQDQNPGYPSLDIPTALDPDGDGNAQNNPSWIQGVPADALTASTAASQPILHPVLYTLPIETETHHYLFYVRYYPQNQIPGTLARKMKLSHDQDIEHILEVIRKDEEGGPGIREFTITSRHATATVYVRNRDQESTMRARIKANLWEVKPKELFIKNEFVFLFTDRYALEHFASNSREGIMKQVTAGSLIFACQNGHASYLCDPTLWARGYGNGVILVPDQGHSDPQHRIFGYELRSLLPEYESFVNGGNRTVFEGTIGEFAVQTQEGTLKVDTRYPASVIRGPNESHARTVLPQDGNGRTPYPFSMPHRVHSFLVDSSEGISERYLFNPFVELAR